jgi:integrase
MAGSRPLTETEERRLLRVTRQLPPIRRALVTAELFGGFRISETLSWRIGQIVDARGQIVTRIGVRPAHLKGRRGQTRWVPVSPELRRALEACVRHLGRRGHLDPNMPLFVSRQRGADGEVRALGRSAAEKFIKKILLQIAERDLQGLSTHSLRKSWSRRLYLESGRDILAVRDGLCHSSIAVTQAYLEVDRGWVEQCILSGDWTRPSRQRPLDPPEVILPNQSPPPANITKDAAPAENPFLPGFEAMAG